MRINGGGSFNMSGGEISGNTAKYAGGVYVSSATATISGDALIAENEVASYGGGLYMNSGTLNINGGDIYKNLAYEYGGGIFLLNAGRINVNGGKIEYNSSNIGGGISANKGTITVNGGEISYNGAEKGGGITPVAATLNMYGGIITGNEALQGGGVYVSQSATANFNDGAITQNESIEAEGYLGFGGGLLVEGAANVADGFKLYDNHAVLRAADIAVKDTSTAVLQLGTPCNERMRGCHKVTNWYPDNENARWQCYIRETETPIAPITAPVTYSAQEVSLKAAHKSGKVACKNANGRLLNEVTADQTIDTLSNNSAITIHRDFEQVEDGWYIGASKRLPKGTKLTLMYYPDGDEASGVEYYYYVVTDPTDNIAFADFKQMGESNGFERSEENTHFISQLSIVFPDNNKHDEIDIWLADTEYANDYPNVSAIHIDFSGDNITKPEGNVTVSNEQGGENTIRATATVTDLGSFGRDITDPEQMLNAELDDYTPVLVFELLDGYGKRIAFSDDCSVTVNGSAMNVQSGIASLVLENTGDYEIVVTGLHKGTYKIRASVCVVSDAAVGSPLGIVVNSATTASVGVTPKEYAISVKLSGGKLGRVFKSPDEDKALSFDLGYIPTSAAANDISITSYKKQENGSYAEIPTQWSYSVTGSSGSATAAVTVPEGTPAGTYRFVFAIGDASENYNIIITND